MTRAYINTKGVRERLDKELKALEKIDPEIVKSFSIIEEKNQYFAAAARLVRHGAIDTIEIVKMLQEYKRNSEHVKALLEAMNRSDSKVEVPLFTFRRQTFYVFPNLKIRSPANWTLLTTVCSFSMQWILDPWMAEVAEAEKDPKKREGFYPFSRAIKRLKRRAEITPQKLMQLLFQAYLPNTHVPDNIIRDAGTYLAQCVTPPEIVFCSKPEHYLTMYENGPGSCMQGTVNRPWGHLFKKYENGKEGLIGHPAVFYHYCPQTQGVYIRERGKISARVILYGNPGEQKIGRIYHSNTQAMNKLQQALRDKGITHNLERRHYSLQCSFEVPVYRDATGASYVMVPYFDNLSNADGRMPLYMRPKAGDPSMAEAKIIMSGDPIPDPKQGWKPYETNRAEGALVFNPEKVVCYNCTKNILQKHIKPHMRMPGDGAARFLCSPKCASDQGYVFAWDQNRNCHLLEAGTAVIDWVDPERNYTTLMAAAQHGVSNVMVTSSHMEEDEEIISSVHILDLFNPELNNKLFFGERLRVSCIPSDVIKIDAAGRPVRKVNDIVLQASDMIQTQLARNSYHIPTPFNKNLKLTVQKQVLYDPDALPSAGILAAFNLSRQPDSAGEETEFIPSIHGSDKGDAGDIESLFAEAKANNAFVGKIA